MLTPHHHYIASGRIARRHVSECESLAQRVRHILGVAALAQKAGVLSREGDVFRLARQEDCEDKKLSLKFALSFVPGWWLEGKSPKGNG